MATSDKFPVIGSPGEMKLWISFADRGAIPRRVELTIGLAYGDTFSFWGSVSLMAHAASSNWLHISGQVLEYGPDHTKGRARELVGLIDGHDPCYYRASICVSGSGPRGELVFTDEPPVPKDFLAGRQAPASGREVPGRLVSGLENFPLVNLSSLGIQTSNHLRRVGIETIGDLVSKSEGELDSIPGWTTSNLINVEDALHEHGLALKDANPAVQMQLEKLQISNKAKRPLIRAGIKQTGNLRLYSGRQLLAISNFGEKSLAELKNALTELGIKLRDD